LFVAEFRRGDWAGLESHADLGEDRARVMGYRYELSQFLLWRALIARRDRPRGRTL